MQRLGHHVTVRREAFGECVLDAAFVHVHYGHECAAGLARHGCDEQADGAGADDEGGGAWGGGCSVYAVDCDGEGLEEGGGVEGYVVWESAGLEYQRKFSRARNWETYLWHQMAG